MGKKSRRKVSAAPLPLAEQLYQPQRVARPFESLPNEAELIQMRELLPAATLKVKTTAEYGSKDVLISTITPELGQGAVLKDGTIMVALQTTSRSLDPAHDTGLILSKLLEAPAGTILSGVEIRRRSPRLTEMLTDEPGEFHLYKDLSFWFPQNEEISEDLKEAISESEETLVPMRQVGDSTRVFWCQLDNGQFIRHCFIDDEYEAYNALARLRAAGQLDREGLEFVGVFRGLGAVVPVWKLTTDLDAENETALEALKESTDNFEKLYWETRENDARLNDAERKARQAIVAREVPLG